MVPKEHQMPRERWVVVGTLRDGEPYPDEVAATGRFQSKARAEYLAEHANDRGGSVRVVREVWNGPGARWDVARDPR